MLERLARAHLDDIVVVLGAYAVAVGDVRDHSTDWERGPARLFAQVSQRRPGDQAAVVCPPTGR
jgi:hypothetical protein